MDEYGNSVSRKPSMVSFVIVAIILLALLFAGVVFGQRYIASIQKAAQSPTSSQDQKKKQAEDEKRSEVSQGEEKEQQAKKDAEEKKKAEEAQLAAETKKREEEKKEEQQRKEAAATAEQSTAPSPTATPSVVATTGPTSVPETGPGEVLSVVIGIIALGYGSYLLLQSKRDVKRTVRKAHGLK